MDNLFLILCPLCVVLIIVHAVISRRKGGLGHWSYSVTLLISFLLLLIYIVGVGWLFYSDIAWPHVGSLSSVFFLLLFPGIAFQSFFLAYSLIKRKLPARRIWARLLSIVLGIVLAVQAMSISQDVAMERFEITCRPLVELIQANFLQPCSAAIPDTEQNGLQEMRNMGHLWHNKEHFIFTFPGRSADVDGSTVYYYSKNAVWTIFHNDSLEESRQLEGLLTGMQDCRETP